MSDSATVAREQLLTVLLATELGGRTGDSTHFSYAKLGSSTYSFGQMQFDVGNNPEASAFLKENSFDATDIKNLAHHGGLSSKELDVLDAKLQAIPQDKMDQFRNQQLDGAIGRVGDIIDNARKHNPAAADIIINDPKLQLGIADFANQFSTRYDDQLAGFLAGKAVRGIQAGNPPNRDDMQNFIGSTPYGQNPANARGIAGRAERLEGALQKLKLSDSPQVAGHPAASHAVTAKVDGTLKVHANGEPVLKLQGKLAELGYTDAKDRPLQADGYFGPATAAAVKAFQTDHGLTPDSRVGPVTQEKLHDVVQSSREATAVLSGANLPATAEMSSGCPYVDRLMATINDPAAFSQAIRDVATSPYGDAFRAEGRALNMEVQNQQLQQQLTQQQALQAQQPIQQGPVLSR